MSDQPTNQPPTDHSNQGDPPAGDHRPTTTNQAPVPIEEAAARLGITVNAVRQRIKRGTVEGYKTPAGWVVVVDRPTTDQEPTDRPTTATDHTTRPTNQRPTTTGSVDLAPLAAVIADLTRENRQLAEAAAIWQVRAVQAEERLKQLTAGGDTPTDAPHAAPFAPGEAQPANVTNDAPASPQAPWWRRWFGLGC